MDILNKIDRIYKYVFAIGIFNILIKVYISFNVVRMIIGGQLFIFEFIVSIFGILTAVVILMASLLLVKIIKKIYENVCIKTC